MRDFIYEITRSSKDGQSLSLTVKGLLGYLVPVVILILQSQGVTDLDQAFFDQLVQAGTDTVQVGATLVSTVMVFYGLLRKLWQGIKRAAGVK